jgi:hypothetical protein
VLHLLASIGLAWIGLFVLVCIVCVAFEFTVGLLTSPGFWVLAFCIFAAVSAHNENAATAAHASAPPNVANVDPSVEQYRSLDEDGRLRMLSAMSKAEVAVLKAEIIALCTSQPLVEGCK